MTIWRIVTVVTAATLLGWTAARAETPAYQMETVAEELSFPWSLAFLPDGSMLLTELEGQLRVIRDGALVPEPVEGVPDVFFAGQGGLSDVVLHPDFAENRLVYLSFSHGNSGENATRVVRARFDGRALNDLEVIFTAAPMKDTAAHYGARMVFAPDGTLLVMVGDGFDYREQAQVLDNHLGSIIRINDDGTVPTDNPFVGRDDARPEIWTYGHRNQQGIVVDRATGRTYMHEHGPRGGDELNLVEKGKNYGWPIATYGIDYSGARISPYTEYQGTQQPMTYWVPSIAPAGMTLYDGDLFPAWKGDLLIAALVPGDVRRIDLENGEIVGQETLFAELGERIRDVRTAPDGSLYLLIDGDGGRILRVTPAAP